MSRDRTRPAPKIAGQAVNKVQAGSSAGDIDYTQAGVAAIGGTVKTAFTLGAGAGVVHTLSARILASQGGFASGAVNAIISSSGK